MARKNYSQLENRITERFVQTIGELSINNANALVGQLVGEDAFMPFRVASQVQNTESRRVPDAKLGSCQVVLVETKIQRHNNHDEACNQLRGHLKGYASKWCDARLLYITPDEEDPLGKENPCGDDRIVWISFEGLVSAIESFASPSDVNGLEGYFLTEKEHFVLRDFVLFLKGYTYLFPSRRGKVVIVPAREAYPFYNKCHAYLCPAGRNFQPVEFMGFYAKQEVKQEFPRILAIVDDIDLVNTDFYKAQDLDYMILQEDMDEQKLCQALADLQVCVGADVSELTSHKVFLLGDPEQLNGCNTSPVGREGFQRIKTIPNNILNGYARKWRYTTRDKACQATSTSDL